MAELETTEVNKDNEVWLEDILKNLQEGQTTLLNHQKKDVEAFEKFIEEYGMDNRDINKKLVNIEDELRIIDIDWDELEDDLEDKFRAVEEYIDNINGEVESIDKDVDELDDKVTENIEQIDMLFDLQEKYNTKYTELKNDLVKELSQIHRTIEGLQITPPEIDEDSIRLMIKEELAKLNIDEGTDIGNDSDSDLGYNVWKSFTNFLKSIFSKKR